MANTAAFLVDRVVPAFKADVLTAVARIFVESVFAAYRTRAKRRGIEAPQCGAVNFVQRFGSLNLHVHFHLVVLDGVFARDAARRLLFHPAAAPTAQDLAAIVARTGRRVIAWLRKHGYLDERPNEERSNEPEVQTALDACAAIAMGRGNVTTLRRRLGPLPSRDREAPPLARNAHTLAPADNEMVPRDLGCGRRSVHRDGKCAASSDEWCSWVDVARWPSRSRRAPLSPRPASGTTAARPRRRRVRTARSRV
jgi:hypothetical protein